QSMAERFEVLRVDGEDYRRRDSVATITALPETTVRERAKSSDAASLDDFESLLGHLTRVHPSRYGAMIDGVTAAHVTGMRTIGHHHDALRFVSSSTGSTTARCRCWSRPRTATSTRT